MLYIEHLSKFVEPASYRSLSIQEKEDVDRFVDSIIKSCWVNDTTFKVKDVVGRKIFQNWKTTPLQKVWEYNNVHCSDPDRQSGIDVGHIFKLRLDQSKYPFKLEKDFYNKYIPIKSPYEV